MHLTPLDSMPNYAALSKSPKSTSPKATSEAPLFKKGVQTKKLSPKINFNKFYCQIWLLIDIQFFIFSFRFMPRLSLFFGTRICVYWGNGLLHPPNHFPALFFEHYVKEYHWIACLKYCILPSAVSFTSISNFSLHSAVFHHHQTIVGKMVEPSTHCNFFPLLQFIRIPYHVLLWNTMPHQKGLQLFVSWPLCVDLLIQNFFCIILALLRLDVDEFSDFNILISASQTFDSMLFKNHQN